MKKQQTNQKEAIKARQRHRRMLTFGRMFRYGVNNFSRNTWLTVAATAVMSVTLLIIFITVTARQVLLDTVSNISKQADMSIYLKGNTPDKDIKEIKSRVEKLENVVSVRYISADESRNQQAQAFKDDPEGIEAIKESINEMPATLRVSVEDLNNQASLQEFVKNDDLYKKYKSPRREPSFSGSRQQAIKTIGEWVRLASIGGSIATIIFTIISSLVVFNTIRMAIFNRKDEIQMMKLIGADKSFIRGPFLVEAVMYGFIAAAVATTAGYGILFLAKDKMTGYGIPINELLNYLIANVGLVILVMIAIGSVIGIISALVATRKYLKI